MKNAGLALIVIAFLGGAYVSVLDAREIMWGYFAAAFVAGVSGVAITRFATKKAATSEETLATNLSAVRESLSAIVQIVQGLNDEKDSIPTYEMGKAIDKRVIDSLNKFVEARESISHIFGLQAYANIMTHYAGGERYLNRVWSASADGYVDEVNDYLGRSLEQFSIASDRLAELVSSTSDRQ
jgi:Na+/melibiose symporter-like transporter